MRRWVRQVAALTAAAICSLPSAQAAKRRQPAPPGAAVYFQAPKEGPVRNPIVVRAGLSGMGVAPAGDLVENAGHHNLLVDAKPGGLGASLPANNSIVHLNNGETEVALTLPRGWHQLQLAEADPVSNPERPAIHVGFQAETIPSHPMAVTSSTRGTRWLAEPCRAAHKPGAFELARSR